MTQLRQRISIVARLAPFDEKETAEYINHRLHIAGFEGGRPLFSPQAISMITKHSGGIPRNINNLCFHALNIGFVKKDQGIECDVIEEAVNDTDFSSLLEEPPVPITAGSKQKVPTPVIGASSIVEGRKAIRWPVVAATATLLALLWPVLRMTGRTAQSKQGTTETPAAIAPIRRLTSPVVKTSGAATTVDTALQPDTSSIVTEQNGHLNAPEQQLRRPRPKLQRSTKKKKLRGIPGR